MKKAVLESLANPDGIVRRVFATQSLSMGINYQNFRCVYHWGIPRSLEQYFQQVEREGRDGSHSQSCYSVIHNLNTNFVCSLQLIIARVIHAYEWHLWITLVVKFAIVDDVNTAVQFVLQIDVIIICTTIWIKWKNFCWSVCRDWVSLLGALQLAGR